EDLLQKIPELIEKAKRIGEQAGVSRQRLDQLIVVFDREGYSAELYRYLDGKDQGAGKRRALFVSWAKYSDKWVNDLAEEQFNRVAEVTYEIRIGRRAQQIDMVQRHNRQERDEGRDPAQIHGIEIRRSSAEREEEPGYHGPRQKDGPLAMSSVGRVMEVRVRHHRDAGQEGELNVRKVEGRERREFEGPSLPEVRRVEEDEDELQP